MRRSHLGLLGLHMTTQKNSRHPELEASPAVVITAENIRCKRALHRAWLPCDSSTDLVRRASPRPRRRGGVGLRQTTPFSRQARLRLLLPVTNGGLRLYPCFRVSFKVPNETTGVKRKGLDSECPTPSHLMPNSIGFFTRASSPIPPEGRRLRLFPPAAWPPVPGMPAPRAPGSRSPHRLCPRT